MDPMAAVPPAQRMAMEAEDRRAEADLALAAQERESALADARRVREVAEHQFESLTGMDPQQWERSRHVMAEAMAAAGFDPAGRVGTAARPEPLAPDGGSLPAYSSRGPAVVAEAARAMYESTSGIDAVLRRNRDEADAWSSSPPIRRQVALCMDAAVRRFGLPPGYSSPPLDPQDDAFLRRSAAWTGGLTYSRPLDPDEAARLCGDW